MVEMSWKTSDNMGVKSRFLFACCRRGCIKDNCEHCAETSCTRWCVCVSAGWGPFTNTYDLFLIAGTVVLRIGIGNHKSGESNNRLSNFI